MRSRLTIFGLFTILLLTSALSSAQSAELHYGETVKGTLAAGAAQDWYFTAARGDVVSINITRTSGNLLPILTLLDGDRQVILGTQAAADGSKLSVFGVRIAQPGVYTIHLQTAQDSSGDYSLALNNTVESAAPTATPVAQQIAGTLEYGQTVRGTISNAVYEQYWRFKGNVGDVIDIVMTPLSGTLDPFISLLSPANEVITTNDSASGGKDAGIFSRQLNSTGTYTIIARRSGASQGQSGLTTGDYELTITVHTPNGGEANTLINVGVPLSGRLTTASPLAEYRLADGGSLAVTLDLISLHRLARVRILDKTGTVIAAREGVSPLSFSAALPAKGPFFVQVSSDTFDDQTFADFSLSIYKLSAPAKPLELAFPADAEHGSLGSAEERWFFTAHSGDLVNIRVQPISGALNATAFISGPQDISLFRGTIGPQLDEPLTLPADGLYQIVIIAASPPQTPIDYTVSAQRSGANNVSFAQFGVTKTGGLLNFDMPVTGTLAPSTNDTWTLDATADQSISLTLTGSSSTQPVGVALRASDDSLIAVDYGQGTVHLERVRLPGDGRYHVIVFDPTGTAKDPYTLHLEDAGGGSLIANQSVKGVLLPSNSYNEWTVDVMAGSLINARLSTRTRISWTPSLYAIDPTGAIIARANVGTDQTTLNLLGISAPITGRYRLIVAGTLTASFASYELIAEVQTAFSGSSIRVDSQPPQPITRFAPATRSEPQSVSVAALIEPALVPEKLSGADVLPLLPNTLARGQIVTGALRQLWRFPAAINSTISIQATSLTDSGLDLTLLDREGRIVAQALRGDTPDTTLTYRVVRGGDYALSVRMGLGTGRYTLYLSTPAIRYGALTVARGTPILYGQSVAGELLTTDQADSYYFPGGFNDVVSVRLIRGLGDFVPSLQLITPSGKLLAVDANSSGDASSTLSNVRLPEMGVYAIRVKHTDATTQTKGRYELLLQIISRSRTGSHFSGILTAGQTVTGALSVNDNEHLWLIQGRAGERVTLVLSPLDTFNTPIPLGLRLQDTAGNTFAAQDSLLAQDAARLTDITLPTDGIYRVQIVGGAQTSGVYRLTWQPERERLLPGPLRYAQTVNGLFNVARTADSWTFTGTANDVIAVSMQQLRGDPFRGGFQLVSENGVRLATAADLGDGSGAHIEGILLPFSGSYTIIALNSDTAYQGSGVYALNVTLQDSKARSMGGTLHDGEQGIGDLYPDDVTDTWLFSGRTGDVVTAQIQARDQFLKPILKLGNASGQTLIDGSSDAGGSATVREFRLPADGVYSINISGTENSSGSYRVGLNFVQPPVPDVAVIRYSQTAVGLVADDRVEDLHVFSGAQGDRITARLIREPGSTFSAVLQLRDEADHILALTDALNQDEAVIDRFVLPRNGTYKLIATRYLGAQGRTAGRFNLSLIAEQANFPVRGKLPSGQRGIGRVDDQTPAERWALEGKAGDVFAITSRATSGDLDTFLTLIDPSGRVIATNDDFDGTNAVMPGVALPADGVYTVILSRIGTRSRGSAGNYEIRADRLYSLGKLTTPQAVIAYGQRVVGIVDPAHAEMRWTFSGNQGDEIEVQLVHPTDDAPPFLSIGDPAGSTLIAGKLNIGQTMIEHYRLPARGFFDLVVRRPVNAQLSYTPYALTLTLLSSPTNTPSEGGILQSDDILTGQLNGGTNYWLLKGTAGQVLSLEVLPLTGNLAPSVLLLNPGGQAVVNQSIAPGVSSLMLDQLTLPLDGIYTLIINSGGTDRSGTYRLTTRSTFGVKDESRSIIPGQPVQSTLSDLRPFERWQLFGRKGSSINARLLATSGTLQPILQLISADGQILAASHLERTALGNAAILDPITLTADGPYRLLAARANNTSGDYVLSFDTAALSTQILAAKAIQYEQTLQDVVQGGQGALWTFEGSAGDAINAVTLPGITGEAPALQLQDSAGHILFRAEDAKTASDIQGFVLPVAGRYMVSVESSKTAAYSLTLQRRQNALPPNPSGRILVPGTTLENGISPSSVYDIWQFNGKQGDPISITAKRTNCCLRLDMNLFGPNGYIGSATAAANGDLISLGPLKLPDTGIYYVVVGRWLGSAGKTTGRYSILLSNVDASKLPQPNVMQALLPTATPIPQHTAQPGATLQGEIAVGSGSEGYLTDSQFAQEWTFSAKDSRTIAVTLQSFSAGLRTGAMIVRADGTFVGRAEPDINGALSLETALPGDGRYSLLVMPASPGQQGRYRFALSYALAPTGGGLLVKDEIVSGTINNIDFTDCWRFLVKAGSSAAIDLSRLSGDLEIEITLIAPDGSVAFSSVANGGTLTAPDVQFTQNGVYALLVSRRGGASAQTTGTYQLLQR